MEFLSALSDDQKALLGCVVALSCTSLLLIISNYIGKSRTKASSNSVATISINRDQANNSSKKNAA